MKGIPHSCKLVDNFGKKREDYAIKTDKLQRINCLKVSPPKWTDLFNSLSKVKVSKKIDLLAEKSTRTKWYSHAESLNANWHLIDCHPWFIPINRHAMYHSNIYPCIEKSHIWFMDEVWWKGKNMDFIQADWPISPTLSIAHLLLSWKKKCPNI